MGNNGRIGGLGQVVDPAVADWQERAALNAASLTAKQRKDRERVVAKYDLPDWLKSQVEAEALEEETSASQLAAFLIAWALRDLRQKDKQIVDALFEAKRPSRSLRFGSLVEIPREVERALCDGLARRGR